MKEDKYAEVRKLAAKQGITLAPCLLRDYPLITLFWAIHHKMMIEELQQPLVNRIRYILTEKPQDERKLRLQALRPVMGVDNLPKPYAKARAECNKARAEYAKAGAEYAKARAEYYKAGAEFDKARDEYDKARDEYYKAGAEFDKAWAECETELITQWDREYPDHPKWDKNGLVF